MVPASYWLGCELHRCRRGAGLASIPKASFLDASETIKGLHGAKQVRNRPAYRCAKTSVYEVICRL